MDLTQGLKKEPFPVPIKRASRAVGNSPTAAVGMHFSDKVLVTISQEGALSQWVQVPLSAPTPAQLVGLNTSLSTNGMLPMTHLTPTTMIGPRGTDRETLSHGVVTQIATRLILQNPDDRRSVVLGIGLAPGTLDREQYFDLLDLAYGVL